MQLLADLGATVHELGDEYDPDLTYTFDPALVTDRGVLPLYPGKPNRRRRGARDRALVQRARHPDAWAGSRATPRAEGGDTFWLDDRTLAVGRTLRTNRAGVAPADVHPST